MAKEKSDKKKSKSSKRKEIAIAGKKTSGTNIGDPREINASEIAPAKEIEASIIDDIQKVQGYELGDAELVDNVDIDKSKQEEFRSYQMGLARQLEAQTRGEGPSLANLQLQSATQKNIAEQLGLAFSNQGAGGALAQRTAAYNVANLNQNAAMQSAQLRMAEQLQAQAALGALSGQARGQDIGLATAQAEANLQTALANQAEKNKFLLAQGEFTQQANIVNATAANNRAMEQARLEQAAAQGNQQAINQLAQQQAALNQQAAIANQTAFNSTQQAQADINAKLQQSRISAGATTAAASAAAAASRYGTDAGLYKFNQELAFEMDKYYQGQSRADINDIYDTNRQGVNDDSAIRDSQMDRISNIGGGFASQTTRSPSPGGQSSPGGQPTPGVNYKAY